MGFSFLVLASQKRSQETKAAVGAFPGSSMAAPVGRWKLSWRALAVKNAKKDEHRWGAYLAMDTCQTRMMLSV